MIWEDRREMIQALWNHVKRGLEFTCWQSGLGKKEISDATGCLFIPIPSLKVDLLGQVIFSQIVQKSRSMLGVPLGSSVV